jgi:hypothetical protein
MFGKKYSSRDTKGRKWKNQKRQREHDRKEEPNKVYVVPTGGAFNFITAAPHCGEG